MANEYLRLQDTQMNVEKAANLLAAVEEKRKLDPSTIQNENNMFQEIWKVFKDFFLSLGKPSLKLRFQKKTAPAISSDYNDTMREIRDDVKVSYTEVGSLGDLMVKNFNYGETERQLLLNAIKKLNSKNIDYSFFSRGSQDQSLYGIDSFIDRSKIDDSKIGAGSIQAEVVLDQGCVTLKRSGNTDRAALVTNVTGIQETIPAWDPIGQKGGYEGLYFGMQGEARPEGGQWHLAYTANGTTLYDMGASEEELLPIRLRMFDGSPETFWEVEYLTDNIIGYQSVSTGNQITVAQFEELRNNLITSPSVVISGDTVVTNEYGNLIANYIPVTQAGTTSFLKVDFIAHLSQKVIINWINLNPNNFGTKNYIDILSIQTSEDGQTYSTLEGFGDSEYDITLTTKANSELTPSQVEDTLSPDGFKYSGQGIWTFAPRKVTRIKFSLQQPQSYIKTYEVLKYRTEQTITQTTTKTTGFIFTSTKTVVDTHVEVKEVELPYLEGIVNGYDIMGLEQGGGFSTERGAGIVGLGGINVKSNTVKSNEVITKEWKETKYDKARFAIGIRDIGLYSYKFAESSEIVSLPYNSPKPISKLVVRVDEFIPKIFYADSPGTENDWIKYYISVDDAVTWHRISPLNHNSIAVEGGYTVPQVININSDISAEERLNPLAYIDTPQPVYAVRFKAVLSRPANIADSDAYTPILNEYALQIYPFGGL